jgi:hypothetical protein
MKPSTSTTSLTELTAVVPDNECFTCLEVIHENGTALVESSKYITCGCRFHVHPVCWKQWIHEKRDISNLDFPFCPICRKNSQHPTPTQLGAYDTLSNKWFVILILLIILCALVLTIFFILYGNK